MDFAPSTPFTVGLEEELLLVDRDTYELAPVAAEVLAGLDAGESAGHEAYAAEIELRSAAATDVAAAVSELASLRARAAAAGATLIGAGVHPSGAFGDAPLVDGERYRVVDGEMRGLIRRTPECALHVHVGMPDSETAIRVFNALRSQLPLLQGLAANSPWWFGVDSGLASARGALVREYPGRGIPRSLRDADDWEQLVERSAARASSGTTPFSGGTSASTPGSGRWRFGSSTRSRRSTMRRRWRRSSGRSRSRPRQARCPSSRARRSPGPSFRAMRDGVDAQVLDDGRPAPLLRRARETGRADSPARPRAR